jgi:hypothetical protein
MSRRSVLWRRGEDVTWRRESGLGWRLRVPLNPNALPRSLLTSRPEGVVVHRQRHMVILGDKARTASLGDDGFD